MAEPKHNGPTMSTTNALRPIARTEFDALPEVRDRRR
jgi:hypothetical protein